VIRQSQIPASLDTTSHFEWPRAKLWRLHALTGPCRVLGAATISSIFVAMLMTGCVTKPVPAPPGVKQEALSFTPPTGMAGIYIVRPYHFIGHVVPYKISLDSGDFGLLPTESCLYGTVPPGDHELVTEAQGMMPGAAHFTTVSGRNYFFQADAGMIGMKTEPLSESAGEELVKKFTLCATAGVPHGSPSVAAVSSDTSAVCRVIAIIPQDDPVIAVKGSQPIEAPPITIGAGASTPAGVGVDLAGQVVSDAVFNAFEESLHRSITRNRERRAKQMETPLDGLELGDSFRSKFQSGLTGAINSSPWLHAGQVEVSRRDDPVMIAELTRHPVVQVKILYELSFDASVLIVRAQLIYFRLGRTKGDMPRYYTYFSDPIGPERNAEAVAKWVASDQALLRQRMDEGLGEVVAMLEADFLAPKPGEPSGAPVKVSCYDALNLRHAEWQGNIVRGGPRILFQRDSGGCFSLVPERSHPGSL